MASITIRNLDDDVKTRLRMRAASHSRSMEEEARVILRDAVSVGKFGLRDLAEFTRECFGPLAVSNWSSRRAARCGNLRTSLDRDLVCSSSTPMSPPS